MKKQGSHRSKGLELVYEDRDLILINKDSGLLTMSPDPYEQQTAECLLTDYVRKGAMRSRLRVYAVHALDRATSGIVIFAKTDAVRRYFMEAGNEPENEFLVIVHGIPAVKEKKLSSYLAENSARYMYSTHHHGDGRLAETPYCVVRENDEYSALSIILRTLRKDQIRVHLADLGHPVVGDSKYGRKGEKGKGMALLSRSVAFKHPHSGRKMSFDVPRPPLFDLLMKKV